MEIVRQQHPCRKNGRKDALSSSPPNDEPDAGNYADDKGIPVEFLVGPSDQGEVYEVTAVLRSNWRYLRGQRKWIAPAVTTESTRPPGRACWSWTGITSCTPSSRVSKRSGVSLQLPRRAAPVRPRRRVAGQAASEHVTGARSIRPSEAEAVAADSWDAGADEHTDGSRTS
jgi:hypothetical protein